MADGSARIRGPVTSSVAPAQPAPNLFDQATAQFPVLGTLGLGYKESFDHPNPYNSFLEFWPQGETGDDTVGRPQEFPLHQPGVEVYNRKTRPIDIAGDIVSHHLVNSDPVYKDYYNRFQQSLNNDQKGRLMEQYTYARKQGETRPYNDWYQASGLPAYFRGYAFNQWDRPEKMYTPQQMQMFDQMMSQLRQPAVKKR